jgi:hypothetical protein
VELPVVLVCVVAGLNRSQDRAVRRRTADAVLFERLDQRRFGEARRRLGEVLFRVELEELEDVAFVERRQRLVVLLLAILVVVFARRVLEDARKPANFCTSPDARSVRLPT